ncbi:MAG TPA: threonine--tRNA ligase, partial [Galbitalea sp.]
DFVISVLRAFGFTEFTANLSTKDPEKYVGGDEIWEQSTDALRRALELQGLPFALKEGDAAFYGPKIDIDVQDAIGRTWQLSTIQCDFNHPERFGLEYVGADNARHRPIMLHRALFGSIERFFAILLEHYAGAFPVWLSPVQVVGIPVAEAYDDYVGEVIAQLKAKGVRAELDDSSDRMAKKIRNATKDKVPFQLIAGEEDKANGSVSFRFRDGHQENGIPIADAIARITETIATRAQV